MHRSFKLPDSAPRRVAYLVVAVGVLAIAAGLALDMSGRATRQAGSDHTSISVFSATIPAGGVVCQPSAYLPADAARAQVLIGTYGHPAPALQVSFTTAAGTQAASGQLAPGAKEGLVTIPLQVGHGLAGETSFCIHLGPGTNVALGGEAGPINATTEVVNGRRQAGRVGVLYLRRGEETWWQLLPTLASRFGFGKASLFGGWTLLAAALLLAAVWVATIRLILRELT